MRVLREGNHHSGCQEGAGCDGDKTYLPDDYYLVRDDMSHNVSSNQRLRVSNRIVKEMEITSLDVDSTETVAMLDVARGRGTKSRCDMRGVDISVQHDKPGTEVDQSIHSVTGRLSASGLAQEIS